MRGIIIAGALIAVAIITAPIAYYRYRLSQCVSVTQAVLQAEDGSRAMQPIPYVCMKIINGVGEGQ